jgi:hypothetical protein
VAKEKIAKADLEAMVAVALREVAGCEGFVRAPVHKLLQTQPFNWSIGKLVYGTADEEICNEAVGAIVQDLRTRYDVS